MCRERRQLLHTNSPEEQLRQRYSAAESHAQSRFAVSTHLTQVVRRYRGTSNRRSSWRYAAQ